MPKGRRAATLVGLVLVGAPLAVVVTGTPAGSATSCAASNTTVTSNADSGAGSLRTAITNANGNSGAQTICIDTTLVTAPIVLAANLLPYNGTVTGTAALTIQGNGAALNGNGHRAITSHSFGLLTVDRLTVTGGANNSGGGIDGGGGVGLAGEPVTVTNSTISGNTATGVLFGGGGVFGGGTVTVTNSTISGNTAAAASGGGIFSPLGVAVTNSTIGGNTTSTFLFGGIQGGGVFGGRFVAVTNSTISGNSAAVRGGGIATNGSGAVTLAYATVVQNSTLLDGAQLGSGTLTGFASVVAQPRGAAPTNCVVAGATTSTGFNYSDDASPAVSCMFNAATDHVGAPNDPMLAALANYGGPTLTMLPNTASPLIDGVPAASCQADGAAGITTDQRGFVRPDPASPNCDIGAVEIQSAAPVAVVMTPRFTG